MSLYIIIEEYIYKQKKDITANMFYITYYCSFFFNNIVIVYLFCYYNFLLYIVDFFLISSINKYVFTAVFKFTVCNFIIILKDIYDLLFDIIHIEMNVH